MIIIFKYFPKNYMAMAIWPLIFVKNKKVLTHSYLLNHEKIHHRQQIELLWLPFFIWYILEFFIRLVQHKNWHTAYHAISFEKEAYTHESDPNYIQTKSFWSFLKYL